MAIAQPMDVETSLLRELTQAESQYVEALLERAQNQILTRLPDLKERAAASPAYKDLVAAVEGEAVARVFRNPDAIRQESEGNYSYTINFQVASGLLDILPAEWEQLGVSPWGSILPATDGYLATRFRNKPPPSHHFQYGWGGGDQLSERVRWWDM
jgi:hypothetical protein